MWQSSAEHRRPASRTCRWPPCARVCVVSGFLEPGLEVVTCEWLTGGLGVLCALPLPVCVHRGHPGVLDWGCGLCCVPHPLC